MNEEKKQEIIASVEKQLSEAKEDLAHFQETGRCSYKLVTVDGDKGCIASEEMIEDESEAFEINYLEEEYVAPQYMEFYLRNKLTNTQMRLNMAKEL